jgi:UDP-GlcNAc:undecaprenyl-phosphate/decaprenyl-phosphate GlcNAc-1-phosphate transferase
LAVPLFLQFIFALLLAAVCIPPLVRWAPRLGLTDQPGPRKVHARPIPRVGGVAMAVGILVPLLITQPLSGPLLGFVAGAITLLAFGVWDDRATLGYRTKFAGQIAAVLLCMWLGDVRIDSITIDQRLPLPGSLSAVLTFLFLVGVTNAVNLSDGLDGLAGGLSLLCLSAIAMLAAVSGNGTVVTLALIECGAILGFLRYNTHPAQIFMGDSGSQLLGFSIGVLAILATQGDSTSVSAGLPLLLLGLPILDTFAVMWQRIRAGRSPFSPDRNHLHHKLLALNFSHAEAVALVYLLQVALFLVAYFLRYESDLVILAAFLGFSALTLSALRWAGVTSWRAHSGRALPVISDVIELLRRAPPDRIRDATQWIMGIGIVAYAATAVFFAGNVGADLGILCCLLLVGLALCAWRGGGTLVWGERIVAYVAVVIVVYLDQTAPLAGPGLQALRWIFIGVIGVATLSRLAFAGTRGFEVTSLDMLVVFVAVVVPLLPGQVQLPPALVGGIGKTIVLLYAVELLLGAPIKRALPNGILALTFATVALRGLVAFTA